MEDIIKRVRDVVNNVDVHSPYSSNNAIKELTDVIEDLIYHINGEYIYIK